MKKIGILGTGMVGNAIGTKLVQLGYEVMMGSRTSTNEKAATWVQANGKKASQGSFADAAAFGEILFNCAKGEASLSVLQLADPELLKGKILVDIANPLDGSNGFPPSLSVCNTDSLGEQIQRALPATLVVKTLNIVNCNVMVNPQLSGGDPTMFMSGNDTSAKEEVRKILIQFGWKDILDLGDITTARGTEMMLPVWLRSYMATKNGYVAFKLINHQS